MSEISKTSIIILTYNKLEYTVGCIESIRRFTPSGTYELIVVDNLSTDNTREWLAEQTDIITIFNNENVGFPKGCNQGIELAKGDDILLLNNDVLVTENWLTLLKEALYSSESVGAVGPVTNSAYGDQEIDASYTTTEEMWQFAKRYNNSNPNLWEVKLKLIGFCMLIKREVIEKVGLLDEIFTPGMCEDSDYSFRIMQSGYQLMLCNNVFIHHFGSTSFGDMPEKRQELWNLNRQKFLDKWGFHTAFHTQSREDLVMLFDEADRNKDIKILDIGCACGATLLKIKYSYPHARLYGIERNQSSASFAQTFAEVDVTDAEETSFLDQEYDYINLGDILHQLRDPWSFLQKVTGALKSTGKIIASVPNGSHYAYIFSLLKDRSLYGQTLDKEQLRVFTLSEVTTMFNDVGMTELSIKSYKNEVSHIEEQFINGLSNLVALEDRSLLYTSKFSIVASRPQISQLQDNLVLLTKQGQDTVALKTIVEGLQTQKITHQDIINVVRSLDLDQQKIYNILVSCFYSAGLYNDIVPLLNASLEIDSKNYDTLFNYGFILHGIGAHEQAAFYIDLIEPKDEEAFRLLKEIKAAMIIETHK